MFTSSCQFTDIEKKLGPNKPSFNHITKLYREIKIDVSPPNKINFYLICMHNKTFKLQSKCNQSKY